MLAKRRAGLAVALLTIAVTVPVWAQTPTLGDTSSTPGLSYPMSFDTVEVYLMSMVPPEGRDDVRGISLSQAENGLRVEGEVRIGAIPGFELLGGLGWAKVTATGPVSIVRPGVLGWDIKTMMLGETPVMPSIWGPLIRRMTKREDNVIPFRVATWVSRVEVQSDQLMLHARGH